MRHLINLVNGTPKGDSMLKLLEGRNYHEMFTKTLAALSDEEEFFKGAIAADISWAKATLKRSDRITWYLRLSRYSILMLYYFGLYINEKGSGKKPDVKPDPNSHQGKELLALINHYRGNLSVEDQTDMIRDHGLKKVRSHLTHFMAMQIPAIDNYRFTDQSPRAMWDVFYNIEHEYYLNKKSDVTVNDGLPIVMKLPNNFEWVNLRQYYSDEEAKAMGHCGNRGGDPTDTILSLRQRVKKGGKTVWQPCLTFILDKDGFLGEMKGRGNQKPVPKYHSAIVKLLENPMIKGIAGGGYLPENNFSMYDLPESDQRRIYAIKPELMPLQEYYEHTGRQIDDHITKVVERALMSYGLDVEGYTDPNWLILYRYDDLMRAATQLGDYTMGVAIRLYLHCDEFNAPINTKSNWEWCILKVLDAVGPAACAKIWTMLGQKQSDKKALCAALMTNAPPEVLDAIRASFCAGWSKGVRDDIAFDVYDALEEQPEHLRFSKVGEVFELSISTEKALHLILNDKLPGDWTDLETSSPSIEKLRGDQRGWRAYQDSFDPEAARKAFHLTA